MRGKMQDSTPANQTVSFASQDIFLCSRQAFTSIYVRRGKSNSLLNSVETWLRSINNEEHTKMSNAVQPQLSILRRKQVQARTGLSRSTIYLYIKAEQFPKPVALGPRAVGWIESEVNDWIAARMKLARGNAKLSA